MAAAESVSMSLPALVSGVIGSFVTIMIGFALTRGAKTNDDNSTQARDIAVHDSKLQNIETTIVRMDRLQSTLTETLTQLTIQVGGLSSSVRSNTALDQRSARIVEEIRDMVDHVKSQHAADHAVLLELTERIKTLESMRRPHPGGDTHAG